MSSLSPLCQLLVSVRSPEESRMALVGGADLIDVKEPKYGSLGRAEDAVLSGVLDAVANRCPVSAAMGELRENHLPMDLKASLPLQSMDLKASPPPPSPPCEGGDGGGGLSPSLFSFSYLKWGLAGCYSHRDWRGQLRRLHSLLQENGSAAQVVNVAYADWKLAQAPPVPEVVDFACEQSGGVLLIDTWDKSSGKNLLNWLGKADLNHIRKVCWEAKVRLALAGSLREKQIADLLEVQPDWFAVRGAVCSTGRESVLSVEKVHRLKQLVLCNQSKIVG